MYPDEVPRPIQRLDVTTTGIIEFARTQNAAAYLKKEVKQNHYEIEYYLFDQLHPHNHQISLIFLL